MAVVFVSHAHGDEALARRVTTLLRDGLGLQPGDFFVSSQGGRGVAPAANIREEIRKALGEAKALIVLVTPASAGSPWIWLETGIRLGRPDTTNPIFLVPSERFMKSQLIGPVSDLRCICLDREGDLHELVRAVGNALDQPPRDVLDYRPALADLARATRSEYSETGERLRWAGGWLRTNAAALLIGAVVVAGVVIQSSVRLATEREDAAAAREELSNIRDRLNLVMASRVDEVLSEYLVLRGVVESTTGPVRGAVVTASRDVSPTSDCAEPDCTLDKTDSDGEFKLDLTRIAAVNRDDVLLTVRARGFEAYSKNVRVDVRAMDVGLPAQRVPLQPATAVPGGGS